MSVVKETGQGCHFLGVGCEAHTCDNAFVKMYSTSSMQRNRILKGGASKAHLKQRNVTVTVTVLLGPSCSIIGPKNYDFGILRSAQRTKSKTSEIMHRNGLQATHFFPPSNLTLTSALSLGRRT